MDKEKITDQNFCFSTLFISNMLSKKVQINVPPPNKTGKINFQKRFFFLTNKVQVVLKRSFLQLLYLSFGIMMNSFKVAKIRTFQMIWAKNTKKHFSFSEKSILLLPIFQENRKWHSRYFKKIESGIYVIYL